jgi:hypothetical protein
MPKSSKTSRNRPPEQNAASGVSTWPRLDLAPVELMLNGLQSWGRVILTDHHLNNVDRAVMEQAVQQLRTSEPELLGLLARIGDPLLARKLLELIAAVAGAAYVVGAHGGMTETQDNFFKESRAKHMRVRRGESERQKKVAAAIEAAFGGDPPQSPYKDADRKLAGVNERLKELGQKSISLPTLYRRLNKRIKEGSAAVILKE